MREIQLRDAKATLSAVIDDAVRGEPSVITRHGRPEAVVLSYADWQRLSTVPDFGRLLASSGLRDGDLPERDRTPLRDFDV
ncbi:type II toxin-antitoxin system Phd/YefM family antitoxin [Methylobacterium sp. 17Sr1-1]|uniref:type II toxin-antitoxin system Phd/YefM family antitoxin n=1 Tax=Methylobacterium sp. 17Sr1-1 TaxID=2202826 RepID=UPI000D6EBC7B|nr:type II toxin-antitoxin system Phd/YefM family antitoxin [Methylobacterium sp. 17Sr1-1]AWN54194.1 type II toxin-antitoxin system prevent-host-death family antitoxin [Methylobacterium sp. 17Sr1-1]